MNNLINKYLSELFPINRSITGNGVLETFNYIKNIYNELEIKKCKSGQEVYDWIVPPVWNIREAYVKNRYGNKIIDLAKSNLSVVSYSIPYKGTLTEEELIPHLHTLPLKPDWIPYRTSYYNRDWGFCCNHKLLNSEEFVGPFEVFIDSEFDANGALLYSELYKKGEVDKEIIISTYCCHPSLANDNLSGVVTSMLLWDYLKKINTRYSYRVVILPETIGALCFLNQHFDIKKIIGGTILTTTAGPGKLSMKDAFDQNSWINIVSELTIKEFTKDNYIKYEFMPTGSDERQYSSPGVKIPTPSFHRSKYYEYDEYHTSADNLNFIKSEYLLETIELYKQWINNVDTFCFPKRINNIGEYQLGKLNLYPKIGGTINQKAHNENMEGSLYRKFSFNDKINIKGEHLNVFNWLMHLCDGNNSNIDISKKSNIKLDLINEGIAIFKQKGLITL